MCRNLVVGGNFECAFSARYWTSVSPMVYNGRVREKETDTMTNTDSLPTWDEIFTNLADEVARYDENIRRLDAITDSINSN